MNFPIEPLDNPLSKEPRQFGKVLSVPGGMDRTSAAIALLILQACQDPDVGNGSWVKVPAPTLRDFCLSPQEGLLKELLGPSPGVTLYHGIVSLEKKYIVVSETRTVVGSTPTYALIAPQELLVAFLDQMV
jgi:hypothetical protein